jgi:hypothetical protein
MDIARFRLVRPAALPEVDRMLRLSATRRIVARDGTGVEALSIEVNGLPGELKNDKEGPLYEFNDTPYASQLQRAYWFVAVVSAQLATEGDRVSGTRVAMLTERARLAVGLDFATWKSHLGIDVDTTVVAQVVLLVLYRDLVNSMGLATPDLPIAARLTRLALVAALVDRKRSVLDKLTASEVMRAIRGTTVVLAGFSHTSVSATARVQLVRDAKVAELRVVRREWSRYVAGELSNVRNLMAGESLTLSEKTIRETETSSSQQRETRSQEENESQSRLSSELNQEISSQLDIAINGYIDASAEFTYPMVTTTISGGVSADVALQRAEQQSSRISREAVSRAISRIDSRSSEIRSRRELVRSEDMREYVLSNTSPTNRHAIYRWVDRIDSYQVFCYPDRLLLEFQIPEPAEFYRFRAVRARNAAAGRERPPAWNLTWSSIQPDNLITLGNLYRAANLPAPPDPGLAVVRTISVSVGAETLPKDDKALVWNLSTVAKELEIPIPDGYVAVAVRYSGEGYPIAGKIHWQGNDSEGFHAAVATVSVGSDTRVYWNGGITKDSNGNAVYMATFGNNKDLGSVIQVQHGGNAVPYGRAFLPIGKDADLNPKPERIDLMTVNGATGPLSNVPGTPNILKIGLTTVGCSACTVTFHIVCKPSAKTYQNWQLAVYDALYSAWAQWKRDYDNSQARQELAGSAAADAGSSERNARIIREELKRSVVGWLLNEPNFAGRPARQPRPVDATGNETGFGDIDFSRATSDAPTIQFLEQAFEWSNISYVFYPYYWAKRDDWEHLAAMSANDPDFESFLRAGSARVIVPARPGFDEAVRNWLVHGIPFIDGHLPAPDDDLYVSIDREIRDLTAPIAGGIAGDTWTAKLGTTMVYLDDAASLPFANPNAELPKARGTVV